MRLYHQAGLERTVDFARTLRFYGDCLAGFGELKQAIAMEERSLDIMRAELGAKHPDVAMVHNSLGIVLRYDGQNERALAVFQEGLDAAVDLPRQRNHIYMTLWANLAFTHQMMKNYELADAPLREAIAVLERSSDRLLHDIFELRNELAKNLMMLKRTDEAEAELTTLIARAERTWGPADPRLAYALLTLSELDLKAGRLEPARARAERAMALVKDDPNPLNVVWYHHAEWQLALVLAEAGEREQALELARAARAFAVTAGKGNLVPWIAEIDKFLTKHARRGGER